MKTKEVGVGEEFSGLTWDVSLVNFIEEGGDVVVDCFVI